MLSAHNVVSDRPVPERLEFGWVRDSIPYLVNFSKGARYTLLTEEAYRALETGVEQLGGILDREIRRRFVVEEAQGRVDRSA